MSGEQTLRDRATAEDAREFDIEMQASSAEPLQLKPKTAKELHDRIVQLLPQFAPAAYRQVIEAASSPFDGCHVNGFQDNWEGMFMSLDEVLDRLSKEPPLPAFTLGNLEALLFGRCAEPVPAAEPHAGGGGEAEYHE